MGNTWSLRLNLGRPVTAGDLNAAVLALSEIALGEPSAETKPIIVLEPGGLSEREYASLPEAITAVAAMGGLFTVWRGGLDFHFGADPSSQRISVSVLHELLEDRPEDLRAAQILVDLFRLACERLRPVHAFSTDEHLLEAALRPGLERAFQGVDEAPASLKAPPILFWLNYFDTSYFRSAIQPALPDGGFEAVPAASGVFVSLGRWPWNARVALLQGDGRYAST